MLMSIAIVVQIIAAIAVNTRLVFILLSFLIVSLYSTMPSDIEAE